MQQTQPDFKRQLHEYGFRATSERVRLLEVLWSAKRPITVDEIGRKLDCNVVTIYRALDGLSRAGLIARGMGSGELRAARFSYAKKDHHHHLVCADCGFNKECAVCE